jgi:hypothetical protein
MNTTPGTNTNPTAVALAEIALNSRSIYLSDCDDGGERYQAILDAVAVIARRNGNDLEEILRLSNEMMEEARFNRADKD